MLTRLKVTGFKNLVDVDVRFGAFTCIAGANGVGKSNLFDAIRFLSALADMPLLADVINYFSPLQQLSAFQELKSELSSKLGKNK
ncbi:MAG: recombination protein [Cyanobacteriota bacterium]|jgi:AAA15 family ATPase/GTPase